MKKRSQKKELMDGPLEDPKLLYHNLEELIFINRWTSAYGSVFKHLKKMIPGNGDREITLIDIGCGAGDFLWYIFQRKEELNCKLHLIGLDAEPHAISFARERFPSMASEVEWVISDYKSFLSTDREIDLITCNLFCHHLSDEEIIQFISTLQKKVREGAVINDLHRHPLAYLSIKLLTRLFSTSEYTKNDAPLSVLRGFRRKEWEDLIDSAGSKDAMNWEIRWQWAFRHLITFQRN
nr:methyltransferase domain-containing protein [Saprospiraceae bacterium]